VTVKPGEAKAVAVPLAATALVQVEFVYSSTVEPGSAVPLIAGEFSLAGETGLTVRPVGAPGAMESAVKPIGLAHSETTPKESVAVALRLVVALSGTVTVIPGDANAAALPFAATGPEQSALV
jgi:hypothetical protein